MALGAPNFWQDFYIFIWRIISARNGKAALQDSIQKKKKKTVLAQHDCLPRGQCVGPPAMPTILWMGGTVRHMKITMVMIVIRIKEQE